MSTPLLGFWITRKSPSLPGLSTLRNLSCSTQAVYSTDTGNFEAVLGQQSYSCDNIHFTSSSYMFIAVLPRARGLDRALLRVRLQANCVFGRRASPSRSFARRQHSTAPE